VEPGYRRRVAGNAGQGLGQGHPGVLGPGQGQGQEQFQADSAGFRFVKGQELVFRAAGIVVGADGLDGAIGHGLNQGFPVPLGPQGRIEAGQGIKVADVLFGEVEVMHVHVAGHGQALGPGGGHQAHPGGRGKAHQVETYSGGPGQFHQSGHGHGLGGHGNASQPQAGRHFPVVGHPVPGQGVVLGLEPHRVTVGGGVLHGPQQGLEVGHRGGGLGHGNTAGTGEASHGRQTLAFQALGQGPQGTHPGLALGLGQAHQAFHQAGFIQHRLGVRRADQGGDTAGYGGLQFAVQIGQAGGKIHQAGANHRSGGVYFPVRRETGGGRAHGGHPAIGQIEVVLAVHPVGGIDEAAVFDKNVHDLQFPARMPITAMRTAMPKVTWLRMTAWGPSATAESISTPRFMGPGCITMASGLARASRSGVRP